jgi:hypothetical protein
MLWRLQEALTALSVGPASARLSHRDGTHCAARTPSRGSSRDVEAAASGSTRLGRSSGVPSWRVGDRRQPSQ